MESADVGIRSDMAIVGNKFKESPPEWRSWKGDAPFNWGNLYAISPFEKESTAKTMKRRERGARRAIKFHNRK